MSLIDDDIEIQKMLNKNDRLQEMGLVAGDVIISVTSRWWYALGIGIVLIIPVYYLFKFIFVQSLTATHNPPEIVYTAAIKQPLEVLDQKVFSLGGNSYSGYAKVKNLNLEWGVASQGYTAEFKTLGGTLVTRVTGSTFVLPSSEKLIVFARFTSDEKPDSIIVTLDESRFMRKPELALSVELERTNLSMSGGETSVSAGIRNLSAFTINQINLPVALYDNQNRIVGVNTTYVSVVKSGETRTFRYTWPGFVPGAVRAEITPELNVFDRALLSTDEGISPF